MDKTEYKKLLEENNIKPNPILEVREIINPKDINDLPLYEWVLIDKSSIGLNYVYRIKNGVFIEFRRQYSTDLNFYTNEYFNNWRNKL